ncbi:MAG: serine/threonine protein kinase [Ectothiorhodospiraceae bacterium]|nr:serine/threonine protein kinase [Ectothiorhodospiraceae bacterium]
MNDMEQSPAAAPYYNLGPDTVLDAVESLGFACDGRLLALNSYENRVYQVGVEEAAPVVVKFYRPNRWTDAAILEDHAFSLELADADIPVVAPLIVDGRTLHVYQGFRLAVYPRRGGRGPELDNVEHRVWLGRFIGRIHAVGQVHPFKDRPTLSIQGLGVEAVEEIRRRDLIPASLREAYDYTTGFLLDGVRRAWDRAGAIPFIRLHGDCHPGNILWTDAGPHFVDLDDAMNGPPIQDLWMLLSGDRAEMTGQLSDVLEGYEDFFDFDPRQLHLLEALRTLRILHHAAWLARRWEDPAFPLAIPWFGEARYWEQHILSLREQTALLDEPPLTV